MANFTWTLTIKIHASPDLVADGFNPTNPERSDRNGHDVLSYIVDVADSWGDHVDIEVTKARSPKLARILKEQGYSEQEIVRIAAAAEDAK